jgi:flagellar FliL protein
MAKKPKKSEVDAEEDVDAKPAPKARLLGHLRNRIAIGAAVILLAAGGGIFAAIKTGFLGGESGDHAEVDKSAQLAQAGEKKPISFVDLPEMMVNLDSRDRPQYLKVKIALEVAEEKAAQDIQPMPRVLDTFQTYMRQLRPTDLEGSAGLFRLKEELTKRVNVAVYPAKVDAVLFKEIVVQ